MPYQDVRDEEMGNKRGVTPPSTSGSSSDTPDIQKPGPSDTPTVLDTYFSDNRVEVPPGDEVSSWGQGHIVGQAWRGRSGSCYEGSVIRDGSQGHRVTGQCHGIADEGHEVRGQGYGRLALFLFVRVLFCRKTDVT